MVLAITEGKYPIDAVHSQLGFYVTHLDISLVRGTFDVFTGSLTVGSTVADVTVSIEAEMASVNTGNAARDKHILGDDFFDAANHPEMTFASTSVSETSDGYELKGDLTIKGITNTVTLAGTYNGSAVFPMDGSTHYGFSMSGTISRSAFGVSYGVPMVTDDVELVLGAQFIEAASE